MKNLLLFLLLSTLVSACQTSNDNPTDLAGMKMLLKEKQKEAKVIEAEISDLKDRILELDPPKEAPAVPVTTIKLAKINFERETEIQANAISDDIVYASSETGGRIIRSYVKENDYVKRGQLVATTDLETIDKQIAEVEKSLELATIVFERQKRLWDQNIGSEIQFLESKNNKERIEKSLETLSAQKSKANVYAPIAGIVEMEFLKQGEMAAPGAPIVQILNTNKIKFVADVPESYLVNVKKGDSVKLFIPTLNQEIRSKISQVGRTIDQANRTFKVEVNVDNRKGILKPNLLGTISFVDFEKNNVVAVPVDLVQEEVSGAKYVFIAEKQDSLERAKKINVEVGESNGTLIIVNNGLAGSETIVNDGSRNVTDGIKLAITSVENLINEE